MPAVSLRDVSLTYPNGATALANVSLDIPAGDALTVIGPSGAGKTSLLRVIAGLESLSGGAVLFDNRDVTHTPPWRRGVALVPQRPALFPHRTVADNLALGLTLKRSWPARLARWFRRSSEDVPSRGEIDRRVAEAAELLRLTPLLQRRPHELSGGEQQRVVLGRAVVSGARVWLLDEPLAALDVPFRA